MKALSVCLLTFNSERLLRECLTPLQEIADEIVIVDSGSNDSTLQILESANQPVLYRSYTTHGDQMNYAIAQCRHDWVLCMDSDEILDPRSVDGIKALKSALNDPFTAYRISRYWHMLGSSVHALYPVSSPDYPVRLFNRKHVRFNDSPVDDKPVGHVRTEVIEGQVRHDTFHTVHEVFQKANGYTSRLNAHRKLRPSLLKAVLSATGAFIKWYFVKGSWRDGRVGVLAGIYAGLYSFMKYFKPWVANSPSNKHPG
jgi:glycosyltransferase involved in cell wall biosynthesis